MASGDSRMPDSLTSAELRQELIKFGYDIPVSVDRDFMLRKLKKSIENEDKAQRQVRITPSTRVTRASSRISPTLPSPRSAYRAANVLSPRTDNFHPPSPQSPPRAGTTFRAFGAIRNQTLENSLAMIVNGRQMQINPTPNDKDEPTKFLFDIPMIDEVESLAVFLTGTGHFAAGFAGQVYMGLPINEGNEIEEWQLLGQISNNLPSAIFYIKGTTFAGVMGNDSFSFGIPSNRNQRLPHDSRTAQIGISIEPLDLTNWNF